MLDNRIDIVLPWVDGTDPEWLVQYNRYTQKSNNGDSQAIRYRDWGLLKYWFRAIEEFMPWVNKVHFITAGHVPDWLNLNHDKINWIKHSDFIPLEYLPTFSANTIELNLHRIKDLSEQFIYFNDDIYVLRPLKKTYFFKNGLPRDYAVMTAKPSDGGIIHMAINDLDVIDRNFNKRKQILSNISKWFALCYGKGLINNLLLLPWRDFSGFIDPHMPNSFLKSIIEEVWQKEYEVLDRTCRQKFRTSDDVNQWLFRYWQLAKCQFYPINKKEDVICLDILPNTIDGLRFLLEDSKLKMLCLNDSDAIIDYGYMQSEIKRIFESRFLKKSCFEL